MSLRIPIIGGVLLAILFLTSAPATADRLGGAYRGPYETILQGGPPPRGSWAGFDTKAFWPFYFEYNKEAILLEHCLGSRVALRNSSWWFASAGEPRRVIPVSDIDRNHLVLRVLVAALRDKSPWVRDAASIALGKLGGAEVVPHLAMRAKREADLEVRQDVLLALGLTRRPEALRPLLAALAQPDERLQPFAALGLALLGKREAVPYLLKFYRELWQSRAEDETAAVFAVALGHLVDEEYVNKLAAPLREKRRELLKVYVCQALGNVGSETAWRWLVRSSKMERGKVRAAHALALSRFPTKDTVLLLSGKDFAGASHRMTSIYSHVSLGRLGAGLAGSERLLERIRLRLRESAEKPLKDMYRAMYAALGLGLMRDPSANDFFVAELQKSRRTVYPLVNHSAMAMALAMTNDSRSSALLRDIVRSERDPYFAGYAAMALGILGDRESRELLRPLLEDPEEKPEVQRPACWALGLLGDPADVPLLLEVLTHDRDDNHTVRGAAAIALGLIGDRSALLPLVKLATKDQSSSKRAFAIVALGCLVDREVMPRIPRLFEDIHYREEVRIIRDVLRVL